MKFFLEFLKALLQFALLVPMGLLLLGLLTLMCIGNWLFNDAEPNGTTDYNWF